MDVGMTSDSTRRTAAPVSGKPDAVTTGLQKLFAAIAEEPIPDDFLRLLDEIDARDQEQKQ